MTARGCTAVTALDPATVLAFLDEHTTQQVSGVPQRRRRYINGRAIGQGSVARSIRRWRSGTFETVSYPAVRRVLEAVGLSMFDLDLWGYRNGRDPFVRNP